MSILTEGNLYVLDQGKVSPFPHQVAQPAADRK